jgi:hypothetical protein
MKPLACMVLMGRAALLLPSMAAADSQTVATAPGGTMHAMAHVDFKIVIPTVLSLRTNGSERVALLSNGRSVSLSCAVYATAATAASRPEVCTASMP